MLERKRSSPFGRWSVRWRQLCLVGLFKTIAKVGITAIISTAGAQVRVLVAFVVVVFAAVAAVHAAVPAVVFTMF